MTRPGLRCGLCGGATRPAFTTTDLNRGITDDIFAYLRCTECKSYALMNPPADLGPYYPESYYGELTEAALAAERWRVEAQLGPVLARLAGGSITEVGPHSGALLDEAGRRGLGERIAVERDARACEYMRTLGIRVYETDDPVAGLEAAPATDAVVMHHVLEHVPDPVGLLDAAARNVRSGGVLVVATPNPQAVSLRICRGDWMHVDAPRHLFLVALQIVRQRAEEADLCPVALTTNDAVSRYWDGPSWIAWRDRMAREHGRAGYLLGRGARRLAKPLYAFRSPGGRG